jgi:hypothetical protein
LPQLAKKRVDRLMEFCQDSQFKLEIVPTATEEFVDSLTFLDEIQEQVGWSKFCEIEENDRVLSVLQFSGGFYTLDNWKELFQSQH